MIFIWKPPFSLLFSVNTSSRQQQMCDITSGMVANYVAATRGSFVQKNFPFVWKNKDIFCSGTGRKPRWSQNMCYSNQNCLQAISYWLKKREWTRALWYSQDWPVFENSNAVMHITKSAAVMLQLKKLGQNLQNIWGDILRVGGQYSSKIWFYHPLCLLSNCRNTQSPQTQPKK